MAKRLTRITTKTGDDGTTGLGDGTRVSKDDPVVTAIGDVDELNSWLGLLATHMDSGEPLRQLLERCQHLLFDLGGELSMPGHAAIVAEDVTRLESEVNALNADLPHLENFILPGGTPAAAVCHLARSVCRRAERSVVALASRTGAVNPAARMLLNRLSDLLFVMARVLARRGGGSEVLWQPRDARE